MSGQLDLEIRRARSRWAQLRAGIPVEPEVGDMVRTLVVPEGLGILMGIGGSPEFPVYMVRLLSFRSILNPEVPYQAGWSRSAVEVVEPGDGSIPISKTLIVNYYDLGLGGDWSP